MPTLSPTGVHAPILQPSLIPAVRSFLATSLAQATDQRLNQEDMAIVLDTIRQSDDKVEELQLAAQTILRDRATSDEGKSAALSVLAEKSVEKFRSLGRQIEQASTTIRDYERQLYTDLIDPPQESEIKHLTREIRASEIRAAHEGDTYDAVFLQALEQGNLEVARALLDAPGGR